MTQSGRWARLLLVAVVLGLSVAWLIWTFNGFTLADAEAYRMAADRLRTGQALYPSIADPDAASVYRYAPWFAAAWVPLGALPVRIGDALWATALFAASVLAVLPLARRSATGALLALLGGTMLAWTAARGNVHPLMILALVHGLHRRSGPIWVALAASLKAVPILFVLIYLARRERWRAGLAVALTLVLVAPMPFLGWKFENATDGASISLWSLGSPMLWAIVAASALVVALAVAWRAPRHAGLASAVAAVLALPRLLLYDLTYLLVAAAEAPPGELEAPDARRQASGSAPTATIRR